MGRALFGMSGEARTDSGELGRARALGDAQRLPEARCGEDCGSQFAGMAECDQVPPGNDHWLEAQSFAGELLLKLQREEAVVVA